MCIKFHIQPHQDCYCLTSEGPVELVNIGKTISGVRPYKNIRGPRFKSITRGSA